MEPTHSSHPSKSDAKAALFRFAIGDIVLFGYREEDEWILARGVREQDEFRDVRRWRFTAPEHFVTQVTRLVDNEQASNTTLREAEHAALDWVTEPR